VLEAERPTAEVPTLPIEYKGRHCPKLSPADFWAATAAYPRGAGTHFKGYRLFPVIDRALSGEQLKDILNVTDLTEAGLLAEHGAGEYQIFFLDSNRRPSALAQTIISFSDLWANPPILNQQELVVGHPKNEGYIEGLQNRGLWRRGEIAQEKETMAGAAAAEATNTAIQELAGITKSAMARAGEKQPAEAALSQVVDMMGTAYKTALSNIGEAGNKGNGDLGTVITLLTRQMDAAEARAERQHRESEARAQRQHEAMLELMKRPAASGGGIDSQLNVVEKMMSFAEKLAERGGGSRPSSWMDRLPDLAVPLLSRMMAAAPPAPPAVPMYAPAPGGPPAASLPAAPVAPAAAAVNPEDDPMFATILTSMGVPPEAVPFAKVLGKVGARAVQMFRLGVSGYAFAADVERSEGDETYGMIWSAGLAELVSLLQKFAPMLGAENTALVNDPRFHAWLADFFTYGEKNGYGEGSDSEPAASDAGTAE
jgi:hypothetical protein